MIEEGMNFLSILRRAGASGALLATFLLLSFSAGVAEVPSPETSVAIREYEDGSGPSAIFRLGHLDSAGMDIFGIVDPILWRVQYYSLEDWSLDRGARPFHDRWKERGSCALSPAFRVWRVHTFPDAVVLQSQPRVPLQAFIYQPGDKPAFPDFAKIRIAADQASLEAIVNSRPDDTARVPARACATVGAVDDLPRFTKFDAATSTTGGKKLPFKVSKSAAARKTQFDERTISLSYPGRWLTSAQELEEGSSVNGGDPIRHFLVTARTLFPGFISTETILFRKSASGKLDRRMIINLGLNRVKLGQRPVAVSSRGEVLVMGAPDRNGFRVQECNFLPDASTSRCAIDETGPGGSADVLPADAASDARLPPERQINWKRAFDYTDRTFRVDVRDLPPECIELVKPCEVGGVKWTPLPELRGASAPFVTRRGFPYGQVPDVQRPISAGSVSVSLGLGAEGNAKASDLSASQPTFFGDINNAGKIMDPSKATVFGIDCSSLVSAMWGLKRWDTYSFIEAANGRKGGIGRVKEMAATTIGDAFVINVAEGDTRYINHIVLFREQMAAGPTDSSQAVLVVEANGSCGGACWSFYDESFFNGWAILRRTEKPNDGSITDDIPFDIVAWRAMFAKGILGNIK